MKRQARSAPTHQFMFLYWSTSRSGHLAAFLYTFISLHLSGCRFVHNADWFAFPWVEGDDIVCDLWTDSRPIRFKLDITSYTDAGGGSQRDSS
ncbi:hypothetical protein SCLCIDRAFT_1207003 [Scleroderma citrinum Foug A]|uniref:Uncharacterized protein n=1 Tax=Scleroderma citrinum Foug A TaxID=1036808 RepID=A0A0C3ERT9_9AGAM|nr:hypothetical protein SCLCIDRAFT_1207003 [Scleroderma citrinum Foug A]